MKTIILPFILLVTLGFNLKAQETAADLKPVAKVAGAESGFGSEQDAAGAKTVNEDSVAKVHKGGLEVAWEDEHPNKDKSDKFNGHWEGIEFGFNGFDKPNYSLYGGNEFMSLNQGKSAEFDFNFYEMNIGLANSYVGLVSGMGLSFNSYRFENPVTLKRGQQRVEPENLYYDNLSKTKLAVSYLTVPVLLEFQIPVNQREGRLFVNAGIIGAVKLGSHTKVKHGDVKDKDRDGFYINQFKYSATARIGYKDVSLFANYSLNNLFRTGKGPELTPFTIGISFLD